MGQLKFSQVSFIVWHQDDSTRQFKMNRTFEGPRRVWEVNDSSGNLVGQGDSTDKALVSLARHLNAARSEIKKSARDYECRKEGSLAYKIRVEGGGCHIFDPNGAPVGNKTFDTYRAARAYCKELLS